jgi:hypothetical protein
MIDATYLQAILIAIRKRGHEPVALSLHPDNIEIPDKTMFGKKLENDAPLYSDSRVERGKIRYQHLGGISEVDIDKDVNPISCNLRKFEEPLFK